MDSPQEFYFNENSDDDSPEFDYESLAPPTIKNRGRVLDYWKEFMKKRGKDQKDWLFRGQNAPTTKVLRMFTDYYISREHNHRLQSGEKTKRKRSKTPTIRSVHVFFDTFCAGFKHETRNEIPRDVKAYIKAYINKQLPGRFNISSKKKEKHILMDSDLDNLLATLWCSDLCNIHHGRQRIQMTLYLLMHAYTGARAGEFIESKEYRGTNRCLTWKDLKLHVYYEGDGTLRYMIEITKRFTKGNQDTTENVTRMVVRNTEDILRDPVLFLLALAFEDKALKDIHSVEQFSKVRPQNGSQHFTFQWNEEIADKPVFRRIGVAEGVTKDAWHFAQMNRLLEDLIQCAGYPQGSITIHTIRRGFANAIERDPGLSRVEKNQAMGYCPGSNLFANAYVSKVCIVDGQSLFRREDPRKEHIELLRTAARYRNSSLPQKMPARYAEEFEHTPEMSELKTKLLSLPIGRERSRILNEQRKLRQQAQVRYQDQWAEEQYKCHVSTSLPSSDGQEAKKPQPLNKAEQEFLSLRSFLPERSRLADLAGTYVSVESIERQSALRDLVSIAGSDDRVMFRPGETPVDERCPVSDCETMIRELPPSMRASHIHACRQRQTSLNSKWSAYCYRCFEWFLNPSDWRKHSEWHLETLSMRCDIRFSRHILVSPGACPFCLGDEDLAADKRNYQWKAPYRLWCHVKGHLAGMSWPAHCPHPLCAEELKNVEDFDFHMADVHSRSLSSRKFSDEVSSGEVVLKRGPGLKGGRKSGSTSGIWTCYDKHLGGPGTSVFTTTPSVCNLDEAFVGAEALVPY